MIYDSELTARKTVRKQVFTNYFDKAAEEARKAAMKDIVKDTDREYMTNDRGKRTYFISEVHLRMSPSLFAAALPKIQTIQL